MSRFAVCRLLILLPMSLPAATMQAQAPQEQEQPQRPVIVDEPKIIDPATLIAPQLAAKATRDFSDSSLREVVAWLQDEHGLVVLVDQSALSMIGVSAAEPVSDRLSGEPIYLLLNRLRSLGLSWYFEDEVLYITSVALAEERLTTLPYTVGDLLDAGYDRDDLETVISGTVAPESWDSVGGPGVLNSLGDVLFVRQTDELHREVNGLLEALRKHARQTFVNDAPQHVTLRQKLEQNVDVDFLDTPLETAVRQLSEIATIDIRLDVPGLRGARVRPREPVTLKLANRKLETVLHAIVLEHELTWILRDGVLWITNPAKAEEFLKVAVYDVRDLCRDTGESDALIAAIESQAQPESWNSVGGPGSIDAPKPGVLVISHEERLHRQVLTLLESYRSALRASKRRQRDEQDADEVITVYYRLHTNVARDLSKLLPTLVSPDSWKSQEHSESAGEIFVVASNPDLSQTAASKAGETAQALAMDRAVLIVRQTRAVHEEIDKVIGRVETGDARGGDLGGGGLGGGGLGGGGFGGGFLSIRSPSVSNEEK